MALSKEDLEAAHSGPAIFGNRVLINYLPGIVHIAFVEQTSENQTPAFRTAAVIPTEVAIELANVLKALLAEQEKQLLAAKSAATTAQTDA